MLGTSTEVAVASFLQSMLGTSTEVGIPNPCWEPQLGLGQLSLSLMLGASTEVIG